MLESKLLFLLMVANGAPVIAWDIFKERFHWPVDFHLHLSDNRPLFGPAKTWRGIAASLSVTPLCAWILEMEWETGLIVASAAMAGDLFSSFCKRRLAIASSGKAIGLDQIPESLFPLLSVKSRLGLDWCSVLLITALFLILELSLSPLLYRLGIRKRPY